MGNETINGPNKKGDSMSDMNKATTTKMVTTVNTNYEIEKMTRRAKVAYRRATDIDEDIRRQNGIATSEQFEDAFDIADTISESLTRLSAMITTCGSNYTEAQCDDFDDSASQARAVNVNMYAPDESNRAVCPCCDETVIVVDGKILTVESVTADILTALGQMRIAVVNAFGSPSQAVNCPACGNLHTVNMWEPTAAPDNVCEDCRRPCADCGAVGRSAIFVPDPEGKTGHPFKWLCAVCQGLEPESERTCVVWCDHYITTRTPDPDSPAIWCRKHDRDVRAGKTKCDDMVTGVTI